MYNNVGGLIKQKAIYVIEVKAGTYAAIITVPVILFAIIYTFGVYMIALVEGGALFFVGTIILFACLGVVVVVYKIAKVYFKRKAMGDYAFGELVENVSKMAVDLIIVNGPSGYIEGIGRYEINGDVIQLIDI